MLTLTDLRTGIAGCNVYRDDVNPTRFYVLPGAPRVAIRDDGKPSFSLVWYRRDLTDLSEEDRRTRLGGGILTLAVDLRLTDEQSDEALLAHWREALERATSFVQGAGAGG